MSYSNSKDNYDSLGKVSLWENFDRDKKYVLSGTVELADGTKGRIYIYSSQFKDNPNSPQFYGIINKQKQQYAPKAKSTKLPDWYDEENEFPDTKPPEYNREVKSTMDKDGFVVDKVDSDIIDF
jgi:hypothetical protein